MPILTAICITHCRIVNSVFVLELTQGSAQRGTRYSAIPLSELAISNNRNEDSWRKRDESTRYLFMAQR